MKKSTLIRLMSFWPPYFGAGIRVRNIAPDFTSLEVDMRLSFWNKNYVGTQFGGSLYSMVDPFYMLMLMQNLGRDYVVWDKAATIRFKRPGQGRVYARFKLDRKRIDEIKALADQDPKVEPKFEVLITDSSGTVIAEVEKILHVSRKKIRQDSK
jgi:hypothetical protein